MGHPAIRGLVDQSVLRGLEAHSLGARIIERVDPRSIDAIRTARPMGWVPLQHGATLRDQALEIMGVDDYVEFAIRLHLSAARDSALRTFVAGLQRMFSSSAESRVRASVRAWSSFSRDAGTYEVRPEHDRSAVAWYVDPCPIVLESPGLQATRKASFEAVLRDAGFTPHVSHQLEGARLRYDISW